MGTTLSTMLIDLDNDEDKVSYLTEYVLRKEALFLYNLKLTASVMDNPTELNKIPDNYRSPFMLEEARKFSEYLKYSKSLPIEYRKQLWHKIIDSYELDHNSLSSNVKNAIIINCIRKAESEIQRITERVYVNIGRDI